MGIYLTFGFLGFQVVKKRTMNLLKGSEDLHESSWLNEYNLNKPKA